MDYGYIFSHLTVVTIIAATLGVLLGKLKQPVMIGYILAGVLVGPSGLALISSQESIHFYSELGILLLLFIIGLELNIKSFLKMWKIPTMFTVIQVLGSSAIAYGVSKMAGIPLYIALLTAFFSCLSSTAAIVKVLEHMGETRTDIGHISIGILVAQDIAVVPMMLIIKQCGKPLGVLVYGSVAFAIALVVVLVWYLGRKEKIIIPTNKLIPNSDLIPVVTLSLCFLVASIVSIAGLSEAYGAFLVGLFIGNTQARQDVLTNIKPIQNVLLMIFFISVGLMFDLKFLWQHWFVVLSSLTVLTIWKIFFNTISLRVLSIELAKATTIGTILAQLGEFSLVLASIGTQAKIIGTYGQKLIICVTALSLSMSPLFIRLASKTQRLSILGDNSLSSIVKIIFSGKFSAMVRRLLEKNKTEQSTEPANKTN